MKRDEDETIYQIRVRGRLRAGWSGWFDGMRVEVEEGDEGVVTVLTGPVVDQAALHGILTRVRDLGLPLVEVRQGPFPEVE